MTGDGLHLAADIFPQTGTEQHGTDKPCPGTDGMNDRRTSEIDETHLIEPAIVPFPAASNRINECSQNNGKKDEFAELDPLSH